MTNRAGFTLIEVAIVLIIIGLLSGGIMAGRSLIRSSELQAVIKEYGVYKKAFGEFQDKYNQLPGDFARATTMWGTDVGGCPNNSFAATPEVTTQTCNGDGNGRIGDSTSLGVISGHNEWWRTWQHLANAKLIDGRYTGQPGRDANIHAMPGLNIPESKFPAGGWNIAYYQNTVDTVNMYAEPTGKYGHVLSLGTEQANNLATGMLLTPQDALVIDKKTDDGYPGTGTMRAPRTGLLPNCTRTDTSKTNQRYSNSYQSPACYIIFILGI